MNNEQIVYTAAREMDVPDHGAVLVVQQAIHESADFSSHVFQTDNNAFGMKVPAVRKSPYIAGPSTIVMVSEGKQPYAHYDSLSDSAKDLVHWLTYKGIDWTKITNETEYAAFLKKSGYYGDSQDNYTDALLRHYTEAKNAIGKAIRENQGVTIATGLTLFAMLGFYIYKIATRKK